MEFEIEVLDGGAWSKRLKSGDYDLTISSYTLMTGEPNFFFAPFMLSNGSMNQNRSLGYLNKNVDELISKATVENDKNKRREMYLQLQEIAKEEGPSVPIYHDVTLYEVNKKVKDFDIDSSFLLNSL